ncbi:MAG TPA: hypothetical protein VLQ48_03080 [Chloroflexia bacterium]|nr:hypothetical protein [Chloroflexia bacterium]
MNTISALTFLPLSVTIVGAAFAAVLLNRYVNGKRRPHELVWGIAFLMFAIAAGSQVYADAMGGWTPLTARLFYLFGAILNVGFLGLGTIYLLFSRRVANIALVVTLVLTAYAIYATFAAPLTMSALSNTQEVDWKLLFSVDVAPRILAGVFSGVGSIIVIAGALWSAYVFWRKRIMKERMVGLILLAVGTFTVAFGGTVKGLLHNDDYLYPTMALGVILMFLGYLQTIRVPATQAKKVAERASA